MHREWAPTRGWGPSATDAVDVIGSYRFDDPEGRVGMEVHLATAGDVLFQVPLTYRDKLLAGAEDALIAEMEHSVLGTRWVYDGLRDPQLVTMLAAVTMTGQGEAVGMAEYKGRWYVAPSNVRIRGGGWTQGTGAGRRLRARVRRRIRVDCFATIGSSSSCTGAPFPERVLRSASLQRGTANPPRSCSPKSETLIWSAHHFLPSAIWRVAALRRFHTLMFAIARSNVASASSS